MIARFLFAEVSAVEFDHALEHVTVVALPQCFTDFLQHAPGGGVGLQAKQPHQMQRRYAALVLHREKDRAQPCEHRHLRITKQCAGAQPDLLAANLAFPNLGLRVVLPEPVLAAVGTLEVLAAEPAPPCPVPRLFRGAYRVEKLSDFESFVARSLY